MTPRESESAALPERFVVRRSSEVAYGYDIVDTRDGRIVGGDGGEPEDQTLLRDWKWVPVELNALAAKLSSLERQRDALVAAAEAAMNILSARTDSDWRAGIAQGREYLRVAISAPKKGTSK